MIRRVVLKGFKRFGEAEFNVPGHVVLAAGPWTRPLARRLGAEVPTRPVRGASCSSWMC